MDRLALFELVGDPFENLGECFLIMLLRSAILLTQVFNKVFFMHISIVGKGKRDVKYVYEGIFGNRTQRCNRANNQGNSPACLSGLWALWIVAFLPVFSQIPGMFGNHAAALKAAQMFVCDFHSVWQRRVC